MAGIRTGNDDDLNWGCGVKDGCGNMGEKQFQRALGYEMEKGNSKREVRLIIIMCVIALH